MKFFAKSTGWFYADDVHGARTMQVVDPAWTPPMVDGVPDLEAAAPYLEVANPECLIPADAVEITCEEHKALLAGQASGRQIVAGVDGRPFLLDAPLPTLAELKVRVLDEARTLRAKLFTVVDGLQGSANLSAILSGVTTDAVAIEAFKVGARDITLVDLGNVADEAVMRDAVQAAYGVLVMAAPMSVKLAFSQALK